MPTSDVRSSPPTAQPPTQHLMNPKLLPPGRLRYMRLRQHPMREAGWSTAPPPKPRALSREMPPDQPWQCHGLLCTAPPNAPTEERCLGCGRDPDGFDRDGYDDHGYDRDGFDHDGEPRPLAERLAMAREANRKREDRRAKAPPPEPTAMALDNWNAGRKQVLSACPDCSWVGQSTRAEARCPMCSKRTLDAPFGARIHHLLKSFEHHMVGDHSLKRQDGQRSFLLVAGGRNAFRGVLSSCELLVPDASSWRVVHSLNEARAQPAAAVCRGKAWVFGGIDKGGRRMDSIESYDVAVDNWLHRGHLSQARSGAVVDGHGGRVYLCVHY